MHNQYQEKPLRAEEIYQQKYRDRLETEHPDKIVAIEITSETAFVADGVVEVLQKALDAGVKGPLFVKRIGSLDKFFAFQPSLSQDKLQAFLQGIVPAYTIHFSSQTSPFPGLMRKLDHGRIALVLFSTENGAREFLSKVKDTQHTVIEVSLRDVQDFVDAQKARGQNLLVEMLS